MDTKHLASHGTAPPPPPPLPVSRTSSNEHTAASLDDTRPTETPPPTITSSSSAASPTAPAPPATTTSSSATASATSTSSSLRYPARPTSFFTKSLTAAPATSTASSSVNIRDSVFGSHVLAPARTSSLRTQKIPTDDWDARLTASSLSQHATSTVDDGSRAPSWSEAGALFASFHEHAEQDQVDSLRRFPAFPLGQSDGANEFGQKISAATTPRDALGYIRSVNHRAEVKAPSYLRSRPSSADAEKKAASISRAPSPLPASRIKQPTAEPVTVEAGSIKGKEKAAILDSDDNASIPAAPQSSEQIEEKMTASNSSLGGGAEEAAVWSDPYPSRKYYILSSAGKPIYISHLASRRASRSRRGSKDAAAEEADEEAARKREQDQEDDEDEMATTQVGVMQALISIFADEDGDKLRHINADNGRTRITFMLRSPLYLVCVSSWGEPPATTRMHLENLYLQVLSLVSAGQLSRLFARMPNFDLRRLLEGTDVLLGSLLTRLQTDMCFSLEALQPVRIEASLRDAVSTLLLPPKGDARPKDLLYVLLLANQRILTLLRPKRHSVHPADMHLLVNTVYGTEAIREPGGESWIPICLPKFAPQGFVHAYVSFLERPDGEGRDAARARSKTPESGSNISDDSLALVIVTGDRDGFSDLSAWRNDIAASLSAPSKALAPNLLTRLFDAVGDSDYSADELGIAGLRHFIYKSRSNVQITASRLEAPYETGNEDHKRLVTLYTLAHDAIHALSTGASAPLPGGGSRTSTDLAAELLGRSTSSSSTFIDKVVRASSSATTGAGLGQSRLPPIPGPVKMQYYQTEKEAVLAWITQPFELYLTFNPWLSKTAIVGAANAVAKWVKANEGGVFITSALTF